MPDYKEVATLTDPDGVSARITCRDSADGIPQFSCQFFREYIKSAERRETVWFSRRHLAAIQRLIVEVDQRIAHEYEIMKGSS